MKKANIYIVGISVIIGGVSCEDVYHPREINAALKIPVIVGNILEGQVPVVNLSWAMGYNDQVKEDIRGASIMLFDNKGDSIMLEETEPGKYTSFSDEFKGVQGRIYILKVNLTDGNSYYSTPEQLPKKPVIDSLYANPGTQTVYTYDKSNKPFVEDQPGLNILADLSDKSDSALYFRFHTKITQQMVYTVDVYLLTEHSIFTWESFILDKSYSSNYTVSKNNNQVLREHHVGFLHYYFDASNETDRVTGTFIVAWVATFDVYSISHNVYEYYNSIADQLNGKDQIFAPLPSKVKSNIYCSNDPMKKVIGVFETNSVTRVYKAFGWKSLNDYYVKNLSAFPDTVFSGLRSKFPPPWWVLF